MAKLNMAKVNTLFRKGYLLAGVMMAANMLVVNEMRAMKEKDIEQVGNEEDNDKDASSLERVLNFVLSWENTINLIGGVVFSGANNYFKWWDYNPGRYFKLRIGCLGWRSKKLFDIVQVDINLNVGRGISWLIPGTYNFIKACKANNDDEEKYTKPLYFSYLVGNLFDGESYVSLAAFIAVFLIQGFVSVPLAIHISNFSIAISLDSMLWAGIGKFLDTDEQ